ncbi:MAG: 50S ribosomal protein L18 [Phycisphaeraceae bacterium]|nr:50S ribosomal protein L18 [Phycisphaeraceae bacterium]
MKTIQLKQTRRGRRRRGIRRTIFGVPARPRLTVFRSAKHMYAQIIDDLTGQTLVSASTNEKASKTDRGGNCGAATQVGEALATRARQAGIEAVVFDRNGFRYHGRVKALADGARKGGLSF